MKNLKVYQKTYDMIEYGYVALKQFPRSEKHTFVAEIKETMMTILRLIVSTNKKYYKKTTIGITKHCESYNLRKKIFSTLKFVRGKMKQ
jgi:hypothetical protein